MRRTEATLALALLAGACGYDPPPLVGAVAAEGEQTTAEVFGEPPDPNLPLTPLSDILADPASFDSHVVRTEGQIAQVCQRMGCWMELRDGEEGPAVRVPMANHAFFLPRESAGRHATIEGRIAMRELSPADRAHLESEGASATASALSIEASGVAID